MIPSQFRKFLLCPISVIVLLAMTVSLRAQTSIRPSAAAGGSSYRSPTTSGATSSSQSYGSSSAAGARQYRSNTLLGDAIIQIDPESRSVVVVTDEETHAEISKVIDNLDHPKPQVLIKVVFVEVKLDKNLDIGLNGSYNFKIGNGNPLSSGSNVSLQNLFTNNGAKLTGMGDQFSYLRLTTDNWEATLNALDSRGNLHVLSRPSIMARNNQEAVIVVGQEVPFVTNTQITSTGEINNTIQYQDVGIILRVTPFISSDKTVEMIVAPEISSIDPTQTVAISGNVNAPVIDKRSAETVVVTPNATTVVIGGMMQTTKTTTVQKVPLLGDIPILGFPFRHTVKGDQRSELLIFLTPYIVESTCRLKDLTRDAANPADLTRNGFPADEILKDLDNSTLPPVTDPKCVVVPDPMKPKPAVHQY